MQVAFALHNMTERLKGGNSEVAIGGLEGTDYITEQRQQGYPEGLMPSHISSNDVLSKRRHLVQYVHQWKHVNCDAAPHHERARLHTYEMAVDVGWVMQLPDVTLNEPVYAEEDA
jgi:hypothetical protein